MFFGTVFNPFLNSKEDGACIRNWFVGYHLITYTRKLNVDENEIVVIFLSSTPAPDNNDCSKVAKMFPVFPGQFEWITTVSTSMKNEHACIVIKQWKT